MNLRDRFARWLDREIGSNAVPALVQHLRDHDYRLYSKIEHGGHWQRDVYHPQHGFFRAAGNDDSEALVNILKQIWLVSAVSIDPVEDPAESEREF